MKTAEDAAPPTSAPGIRIAHVVHSFATGGLERVVSSLLHRLAPEVESTIVCLTTSGPSARLLPPGTPLVEMRRPPKTTAGFLWRLSRRLKRLAPDLVATYNWSGVDGIIAARLAGLRTVVQHEHGWGMEDAQGTNRRRIRARRFLSRWTRRVVCVSEDLERWLRDTVRVHAPVTRIPNGVDAELFQPGPEGERIRSELEIAPDAFVAGVVARLDPIKSHPTLLGAFREVRTAHPDARLLVVGDGPERQRLEALARPGVHLLGERPDVPEILRALDVFVLPSIKEGMSMTILEAMATGLPVIATRTGGNPELVQPDRTGLLVEPSSDTALAAALLRYAADPALRAEHGAAARRRVLTTFTLSAMADRYRALYRSVALLAVT